MEVDLYKEIYEEVLPKRAKLRAMNLLTKRDYTEKELRTKLLQGEYPEEIIQKALDYVKSFRYVDDERYAQMYVNQYANRKPKGKIKEELARKGIGTDCVDLIYEEQQEDEVLSEVDMARELLKKKHYNEEQTDYKEKQRLYGFLLRRGFSADVIYQALKIQE